MPSDFKDSQWIELKNVVFKWIEGSPIPSIDVLLALWLDDSGSIKRQYEVFLLNIPWISKNFSSVIQ